MRDVPRHQLPAGSVWNMVDFVPARNGEPLLKRGPWTKAYTNLSSAVKAVCWAPFSGGPALAAATSNGHIWTVQSVSGVPTFVDKGTVWSLAVTRSQAGSNRSGSNAQQVVSTYASGGTFTLSFNGETTSSLGYNATAGDVLTALEALAAIPSGGVSVTLSTGSDGADVWNNYTVEFKMALGLSPQPLLIVDGTSLTSSDSTPDFSVTEIRSGVSSLVQSEVQVVTVGATGGTFTLSFGGGTTSALNWNAPSNSGTGNVQTAVQALPNMGAATVTGSAGGPYTITFAGALANSPQPLITADGSNLTNTGTGPAVTTQRPVFFHDNLFVGQMVFDGTHNPVSCASVFPNLSSAVGVYKSRLVASDGQTVYFSDVLDHKSWDVYSYVKASRPIKGIATLSGSILIFGSGSTERLRGTTPPTSTSSGDMVLEPAFSQGCTDPGSIVVYRDQAIFANETGVWMTDGAAAPVNLVERGGLKEFWINLMTSIYPSAGAATTPGTIACGVFDKYLVVSVVTSAGSATTMLCDLQTFRWMFFSNVPALMFAESQQADAQLFFAPYGLSYVGELSNCFVGAGSGSVFSDPNDVTIAPVLELPFYRPGSGKSRFRDFFLGVNIDNSGGGTGKLLFDYVTLPDSSSYTNLTDDSGTPLEIGGTSGYEVRRVPLHLKGNGLGLRIRQTGGSKKTALYEFESNMRVLEGRY